MPKFNPEWLNRPRKRGNPEGQLQLQIIHYYKAKGYIIGKIKNKGSRLGNRFIQDPYAFLGLPDLLLFTSNKMFFIEVKAPQGKQSEYQTAFQNYCNNANIPYILAYSLEDVQEIVK
jgi:hypothetical protein